MSVYHIIGDADTVLGYRFAGVSGTVVENAEQARAALKRALAEHRGILLITEAIEEALSEEVTAHRLRAAAPFLTVVEDIWGKRGKRRSLQDVIYEAIGIRLVDAED